MTVGLAALLAAAAPAGGHAQHVAGYRWFLAGVATGGGIALLVSAGLRARGARRAALWGIASGGAFGMAAVLIKTTVATLHHGGAAATFGSWKPYAMVFAGACGVFLYQNAVQAGSLVAAQPGVTLTDPIVSVAFGILLFGERARLGIYAVPELIGIALIAGGTIGLARSPVIAKSDAPEGAGKP
jgi:hypothetical protein